MSTASPAFRIFVVAITLIAAASISIADISTGYLPEITIFVLFPVIAGTYFIGFRYGLFVALFAAAFELVSHLVLETGTAHAQVIADSTSHTLIYILAAALLTMLLKQLRTITSLEELRSNDLAIAKSVHSSVFSEPPASYRNLSIGRKMIFSGELGGDYFHITGLDRRLFFCIADISGKSIAAALFTSLLQQSVTEALEHTLDLTRLTERVNGHIISTLPEDMFVTMFCALIDEDKIAYINAGHTPPLLYSKQEKGAKMLQSSHAMPLGIKPDLIIAPATEPFSADDILLATTDGITESSAFRNRPYEKLKDMLRRNAAAGAQDIADTIFTAALPGSMESPLDDAIVLVIKRQA